MTPAPRLPPPVLAITAGELRPGDVGRAAGARSVAAVRAAVAAGLGGVLVREPALADGELLELARALRAALGPSGWLGVHDRAHLVLAAGADGLHVGFRSLAPAEARRFLPACLAVGLSTHAADDPASWAAADYLFHGPVRDTPSKRGVLEPIGFDGLARACGLCARPIWALGGLEPQDAPRVRAAGCAGMAVLSGLLAAPDPRAAAAEYGGAWGAAGPTPDGAREADPACG